MSAVVTHAKRSAHCAFLEEADFAIDGFCTCIRREQVELEACYIVDREDQTANLMQKCRSMAEADRGHGDAVKLGVPHIVVVQADHCETDWFRSEAAQKIVRIWRSEPSVMFGCVIAANQRGISGKALYRHDERNVRFGGMCDGEGQLRNASVHVLTVSVQHVSGPMLSSGASRQPSVRVR